MSASLKPSLAQRPRRRLRWLSWAVSGLSAVLVISLVGWSDSFSWGQAELHDSGIWVTNGSQSQYGRVNKAAGAIDTVLHLPDDPGPSGARIDVLQDGNTVALRDLTGGRLLPVDAFDGVNLVDDQVALPSTTVLDLNGGTLAAVDTRSGEVRLVGYGPDQTLDLTALDQVNSALTTLPLSGTGDARVDLAVGLNGVAHVVTTDGLDLAWRPGATEPVESRFAGAGELTAVAVTLVGDKVVAGDPTTGRLWLPDGQVVEVSNGVGFKLQRPSAAADVVWLATGAGLVRVKLADGQSEELSSVLSANPTEATAAAEPVVVAGCALGAWAGSPGAVLRACPGGPAESILVDRQGNLLEPVFRVNRSLVVLNDIETGRVFDLERGSSLDFWNELQPPDDSADDVEESRRHSEVTDPEAVDDVVGVRAGRVGVAHVLDNDSDANGHVLTVSAIQPQSTPESVGLSVAPDGQSVLIDLPEPAPAANFSFSYEISNGVGRATAQVMVEVHGPELNDGPSLRPGATVPVFPVASFGSLALPVLGDWRDPDSDAVVVTRAEWEGGRLPVTGDGLIHFAADRHETTEQVELTYWVTDGQIESEARVNLHILGVGESHGVAPVAFPDVVRAEVGSPIRIFPLRNDMVGADPTQPSAKLALQGSVLAPEGVEVKTDPASGLVELIAQRTGTYQLDYTIGFGSAPFGHSFVRVDVVESAGPDLVVVPDRVAVRGLVAVSVDVLGNDWDARGSVLSVVGVAATPGCALKVAVVDGRWVRVVPLEGVVAGVGQCGVRYEVVGGDGVSAGGFLEVVLLPPVAEGDDVAVVNDDWVRVRVGDQVAVDVLSNDASVSGAALVLDDEYAGMPTGELPVVDPAGLVQGEGLGRAFARGDRILFVAPDVVSGPLDLVVEYQASSVSGLVGSGLLRVQVWPEPSVGSPGVGPSPGLVEVRAVLGGESVVPVGPYGLDSDGDSVLVLGLVTAPRLGRVLEVLPTGVRYQSFPGGEGATDEFQVLVGDRYGRTGFVVVRVGLVAPGRVQVPVAVDDVVTAAPGAVVSVFPASNDLVALGERAAVSLLEDVDGLDGASLDVERGLLRMVAPDAGGESVRVAYALVGSAGVGPGASVSVRSRAGRLNPPRVYDHLAVVDGGSGWADVLDDAWDVDGEPEDLRLVQVLGAGVLSFEESGRVEASLLDRARSVVFVVEDASGSRSAGVLFVPGVGAGGLGLVSSGEILVDQDSSVTVNVNDYVLSPRGAEVRVTLRATLEAAPASALSVEALSPTQLQVTARNGYVGPGSITMEVMDAPDSTDPDVLTGTVTIPVQVGPVTPVLRCPAEPVQVVQGGRAVELDVARLCHVWMPDPAAVDALLFEAEWESALAGVSVSSGERVLSVQAAGVARPSSSGRLSITVAGFAVTPGDLVVTVVEAPRPELLVGSLLDVAQGSVVSHRVQVVSPLVDAKPALLSVRQLSGMDCGAQIDGLGLVLSPGPDSYGQMLFEVTATDLASDRERQARHVSAVFSMVVYGRPEAPSAPVPGPVVLSHGVGLVWSSGADHGASVEEFELVEVGSGKSWSVGRATRFDVVGLSNGVEVCFQVRARNRAGWSDFSLVGPCQVPNEAPGRAAGFQVSGVGDGALSLVWDPAPVDGTPVTGYRLVWPGGVIDDLDGSARQATVTGLDNYTIYDFTLTARNVMGWSEQVALTSGQPSGRPTGLTGVTVSPSSLGGQVELALTWPVALPNGPGPVTYMVTRSGGPQGTVSFGPLSSTSLVDRVDYDGSDLVYEITATNASGGPEHTAGPVRTDFHAVSPPDPWLAGSLTVVPTGQSGQAKLTLVVPPSHGGASQLTLIQGPGGSLVSPGPNGGTVERVVSGFTDGYDTAVQVKLCNEDGQCQISSIVYVSTFGQLVTPVVTAWPHGSYGDHQVCAQANAEAMGAGASLVLRSSNGYVSEPRTGPNALFSGDFCVDAGGQEITITFTATLTSDPTNPTRPNPTPGTAQATTPKDPKPPLEKPVLEVILGGLGDHLVCATAHGDGRGYPASLYVSNSFDSTRSATVSGDNALNTTKLCVDPGGPGVQVTFTAHLSTGVTDPPRANAPDVTITATSSANPLLTPTIQANTPGTTGDYRVCASAQGNGQGTPAKLYITSSNGQTSTTDSGSGALSVSNWCITVDPSQTITFTAHLDNDFSAAPRDNKTATASATAPNPPPAFATPGIVARADSGYSGYGVCFNASGQAAGYPAQLKVTVNLSGAGPWQTSYGTGYLGLNEICFDTGKPSTTFTFTVTLTSQAGDRADATNTAMIKTLPAPSITVYKGAKATVDSYYIGIYTHDFPGNVTCQVVDHSGGVDFAATGTWGPNQRKDSGSHLIQFGSGVWVKVRCWSGAINFTSDKLYF